MAVVKGGKTEAFKGGKLTAAQKKLPKALQAAILKKMKMKPASKKKKANGTKKITKKS
jgi:hypothetical protein